MCHCGAKFWSKRPYFWRKKIGSEPDAIAMQATGCRPMLSSGRPPTAPSQECCVEQQMAPDTSGARTEWPSSQRPFLRLNTTILTRNASPFTSRFLIATQHSPRSCWNRHTATLLLSVTVSYCQLLFNRKPRHIFTISVHAYNISQYQYKIIIKMDAK